MSLFNRPIGGFSFLFRYLNYSIRGVKRIWPWCLSPMQTPTLGQIANPQDDETDNPYLQSRLLWQDLYGDIYTHCRHAQCLNRLLIALLALVFFGALHLVHRSRVELVPFLIHGHEVVTATQLSAPTFKAIQPTLARYFAENFIQAARSRTGDAAVDHERQLKALAFTTGDATTTLTRDQAARTADSNNITVTVTSILQESSHILDVRWLEVHRDQQRHTVLSTSRHWARLIYRFGPPSTQAVILKHNPLGFYLQDIHWAIDQAANPSPLRTSP